MIVSRILQIIEYKGLNKRKFYIETGLSNGFLDKVKDVGASKIEHILNVYPDISMEWLLTGNGNMIKSHPALEDSTIIYKSESDIVIDNQDIPVYNTQTTVGIIDLFGKNENQKPVDHIKIPRISECDGALYIIGNSMSPILKNGDIAVYKKILNPQHNIVWGELYLIYINNDGNEYFFTRFLKKAEHKSFVLFVAQNPHHETIEFPISSIKALALVKATLRVNTQF